MRKLSFGLAFTFGWLIAYVLLVLSGAYPSPLWGGEGVQSGLFVLASAAPGAIATSLLPQSFKLVAFPIAGAIAVALIIPTVSLCASILDVIGSKGYLPWVLFFAAMQLALSLCLVFIAQAGLLRVARANSLRKHS